MAWFHYEDGTPAPWFKGKFDPEHLMVGILVMSPVIFVLIEGCPGKK